MSQRVMIAMAIACRPKLLIADEPTTALDVTIQAQIIELLLDLQQRENMALLLITHDLALVAEAAHHIIVMYAGRWWNPARRRRFSAPRATPIPRRCCARCRSSPPTRRGWLRCRAWCRANTIARPAACSTRVVPTPTSAAATRSRNCAAFPAVRLNVTHRWMMREADRMSQNQPLLQAIDLKKHYPVKKGLFAPERLVKALDGVSFTLERGKTLAVVGESGCGKSTLGRLLTMIEVPTGGELYYQGQDLLKPDVSAEKLRRQKIQIVFQNPYGSLNPRKKVGQILEEPLLINTSLSAAERRKSAGDDGEGRLED